MVFFQDKSRKKVICRNLETRREFSVSLPTFGATSFEKREMNRFHNVVCLKDGTVMFTLSNFVMGSYTETGGFKIFEGKRNVSFLDAFENLVFQVDEAILKIRREGIIVAVMNFDCEAHSQTNGLVNISRKIKRLHAMGTVRSLKFWQYICLSKVNVSKPQTVTFLDLKAF